jgi:hypothetical protein
LKVTVKVVGVEEGAVGEEMGFEGGLVGMESCGETQEAQE